MPSIEALNLIDVSACILGQVEEVHLAMTENNSHADCGVPKAAGAVVGVRHGIMLRASAIEQKIELPLEDARCRSAVSVVRQEDVVVTTCIRVALLETLISIDRA